MIQDDDIDPQLAQQLQALHADLPDDGFTTAVMARIRPRRSRALEPAEDGSLLALAAVALLAVGAWLLGGSGGDSAALAGDIGLGAAAPASVAWLTTQLHGLLAQQLTWLIGGLAAVLAMLLPLLLEDA